MPFALVPDELRLGPFTTASAAAFGVSPSALRGSQWRHIFRDVWAHVGTPDTRETRLAAVKLILRDDGFICGLTTAWLYGIDVQDGRAALVWVGNPTGSRPRARAGTLVREITVDPSDLRILDSVPMTNELRTLFDCARWLSLVEAVVVADFLAHRGAVTAADLAAYLSSHPGLRGNKQVALVVDLMEPKTESPMETRIRLLLVLAGLPRPEPQYEVTDARGRFVARADFAFVAERVIVEYDGALHWLQRQADDERRAAMRALGWNVLVFGSQAYYEHPQSIVTRVRAALSASRA